MSITQMLCPVCSLLVLSWQLTRWRLDHLVPVVYEVLSEHWEELEARSQLQNALKKERYGTKRANRRGKEETGAE